VEENNEHEARDFGTTCLLPVKYWKTGDIVMRSNPLQRLYLIGERI
jgi:hypothetical protein